MDRWAASPLCIVPPEHPGYGKADREAVSRSSEANQLPLDGEGGGFEGVTAKVPTGPRGTRTKMVQGATGRRAPAISPTKFYTIGEVGDHQSETSGWALVPEEEGNGYDVVDITGEFLYIEHAVLLIVLVH